MNILVDIVNPMIDFLKFSLFPYLKKKCNLYKHVPHYYTEIAIILCTYITLLLEKKLCG